MKEPSKHRPAEYSDPEWGDEYQYCQADREPWPCRKWQRWTASKEYRLKELEDKHELLVSSYRSTETELRETREKLRRLELLVRGGVLLALRDAGHSGITEEVTRDVQDYTMAGSSWVHRVAGLEDYTVTYTGRNTKYVNGELTEAWSP